MARNEEQSRPTRKQLVGRARDQAMNRALMIATGVVLALVVGLVGWGLLRENVLDPQVTVAVVEGKEIKGEIFQSRTRLNRQQIVIEYLNAYQNFLLVSNDPGLQEQVFFQLNFIRSQLEASQIGFNTINQLVDDELIILGAQELGISVSEDEVERQLEEVFSFFPAGTPTPLATITPFVTSTLNAEQLAIVTATPSPTLTPTLEGASDEATATATNEAETPAEPTPTAFTREAYEELLATYLEQQEQELGLGEAELRALIRVNLYRNKLFEYLTADTETEAEHVWARHILFAIEDEETAQAVLDELQAGGDFGELATEHSIDASNAARGGDLGWFPFGQMVEPFAEAAFALEVGETSGLVESTFGWHIIQVLGREVQPINPGVIAQEHNEMFQDYIADLRAQYDWEIIGEEWLAITPDEPDIPSQYLVSAQGQ